MKKHKSYLRTIDLIDLFDDNGDLPITGDFKADDKLAFETAKEIMIRVCVEYPDEFIYDQTLQDLLLDLIEYSSDGGMTGWDMVFPHLIDYCEDQYIDLKRWEY